MLDGELAFSYCLGIGGGAQGYAVYSGRNSVRNAKAYLNA